MATRRTLNRLINTVLIATVGVSALGAAVVMTPPAVAQWGFDDRFGFPGDFYRRPRPVPREQPVDSSRAPAARKPDAAATTTVVVMGDSMADWLAHGLEQAFTDTPEVAVLRKHRTYSGLIRETRGDPPDWPVLAREILAAEKPAFVIMMIGHNDIKSIREPRQQPPRPGAATPPAAAPAQPPAQAGTPPATPAPAQPKPEQPPAPAAEATPAPAPAPAAPAATTGGATHEFRSEKWVELYTKRIDDTIAAMKSKGVPVLWVGLPAVRRENAATEHVFLNELYKARVEKAGLTYVDVWDGFVDESGRYSQQGPDFEGQTRRLRSGDGVHFTQAGARKLAHYVEREIRRVLSTRATPIAVPVAPTPAETPQAVAPAAPGGAVQRPLAGPVLPLATPTRGTESTLLGGGPPPRPTETPASKVIVRGEPIAAPAGRSDDFAWPRRGVAPPGTDPVATTTTTPIPVYQPPPPQTAAAPITPGARPAPTADAPPPGRRPAPRPQRRPNFDFFGFWR